MIFSAVLRLLGLLEKFRTFERALILYRLEQVHISVSILYLFRLGESLDINSPIKPARNI